MKKFINTELISKMNPCKDRLDNYTKHYSQQVFTLKQFFKLKDITYSDKIWVSVRLLSRTSLEVFAIDCAVSAQQHAIDADAAAIDAADAIDAAAYAIDVADAAAIDAADAAAIDIAAYAADAAAYAAYAAIDGAATKLNEQEGQLRILEYLFENDEEEVCEK
jgi:ribosome-associated translation inhibitor RaiA